MADGNVHIAVNGVRHHRMENDFDAHGSELPRRFRKPDVIAVQHPELADTFNIESQEFASRLHPLLQRAEWEHLAIAPDDLALRIDHRGGVENPALAPLIHGAIHQPDAMMPRHVLEIRLHCSGKRLGMLQERAKGGKLRKHDHLYPWIEMHGEIQPLPHGQDIGAMVQVHLDAGNGKWFHGVSDLQHGPVWAGGFSNMNRPILGVSLGI